MTQLLSGTDTATKALPERLRRLFRRILGDSNYVQQPAPQQGDIDDARSQAEQENARRLIERYEQTIFDPKVEEIAARFARGEITSTVMRALMQIEIRGLIVTGAAAGAGGIGNLDADDRMRIDAAVRRQMDYLDNWLAQAERTPAEARSEAEFQRRARLYGGAGGQMVDETIDQNRFREFPNMPFYAKQRCICRANCACGWLWTNVDKTKGDADVHWRLNYTRTVTEHCLTCLLRASTFSPLIIRNFEFVNMPADLAPYLTDR